jgi:hypothetical protein
VASSLTAARNGSFTTLFDVVSMSPLGHFPTTNLRRIAASDEGVPMTDPIRTHRLLPTTMAFAALIGWGAFAYSVKSSATRDQERVEAIARIISDRNGVLAERTRLLAEQERLVAAQQRLHGELTLAKVQLAEAREEIASPVPQREVAKKGDRSKAAQKRAPGATTSSELTRLIAASQ